MVPPLTSTNGFPSLIPTVPKPVAVARKARKSPLTVGFRWRTFSTASYQPTMRWRPVVEPNSSCFSFTVSDGLGGTATADALAETCRAYAAGMKAEDASIKVGVTLDAAEAVGAVLRRAGDVVDFVSCGATGACGVVQAYNRERGTRVALADTGLAPLRDRYVAQVLRRLEAPLGVEWQETPATSRQVAVSPNLLAHFEAAEEGRAGVLTLGYDPILWGVLMPILRLLEL